MKSDIQKDFTYEPTDMVVAREIEGELIIVPIESGIADLDDALYTFNETGRRIWNLMCCRLSVNKICEQLSEEYDRSEDMIFDDVTDLLQKLLAMKIIQKAE